MNLKERHPGTNGVALLEVENLSVSFPTRDGLVQAVRGFSFTVERGRTLAIVGESGSGKSVATQSIVGLTIGARISGVARFSGVDLLTMSRRELREVRGARIGMIFQDPLSSFHPYYKIGWQIAEVIRAHERVPKRVANDRAVELLGMVGLAQPERRSEEYPHQFSGGMRQRAMIAMALALNPELLIADEPTTALDVTVQAQIIDLLKRLQAEFGIAVIMITHDLGVVADIAHEVIVMYAGQAVEAADRRTTYYRPHHPYTVGLLGSLPQRGEEGARLRSIPGLPPSPINRPSGCAFHPRCDFAMPRCELEQPELSDLGSDADHRSACFLPPMLLGTAADVDTERAKFAAAAREHSAASIAGGFPETSR